ncbi:hypothetical protein CspeluHIS016_0203020 [Cutaneotrichosporon spelunceum]|uniref:Cytochrome b-c1 complex subunit 2, mitochondrial n=1 Tax=Cutaneotrichosporon spelunceum TaxID=1672016 RepID=A0AAD3TRL5_9TREE|nr:hypothetical protein CspeluHIS016_0203020 [Cutaneotrichosporon spelunceum]
MSLLRLPRAAPALRRSYATAANVTEAAGVKVLGIDNGLRPATTSVSVIVKAGSRYEPAPGVAHVLKNFVFKSTASGSALKTTRETELYGGVLSAGLSREYLYINAEFLRGDEGHFLPLMASVLSSTQFTRHEYSELVLPTVQGETEAAAANSVQVALDTAANVAFRRGLGNSIFASPHSPVTLDTVKSFAQAAFAKSNIAVVGQGISTEALAAAVTSAFGSGASSSSASLQTDKSQYYGGEARIPLDTHSNPTAQPTLVISYGQVGATSPELAVLPHILGGQSSIKWSPGSTPLSKAAEKVAGATVRSFVTSYSDASLLNIVIQAPTNEGVRAVAQDVAAAVKGASGVKEDELKRAIAKAKFADATTLEHYASLVDAAAPAIFAGQSVKSQSAALDGLSTSGVSQAAKTLFSAKPTVVAVGSSVLPYADELGL